MVTSLAYRSIMYNRCVVGKLLVVDRHYLVYFLAGVAIGACDVEPGLLTPQGCLARHWSGWTIEIWLLARERGDANAVSQDRGSRNLLIVSSETTSLPRRPPSP